LYQIKINKILSFNQKISQIYEIKTKIKIIKNINNYNYKNVNFNIKIN